MIESTPLESHDNLGPLNRVIQKDIVEESIDQTSQDDVAQESLLSTPRRASTRLRIKRTGERERLRKLFNLKYAEDIKIMSPEHAFVTETSIKTARTSMNGLTQWPQKLNPSSKMISGKL